MAIYRYMARAVMLLALIFSLLSGRAIFASDLGSKDELDIELSPAALDDTPPPEAKPSVKAPAKPARAPAITEAPKGPSVVSPKAKPEQKAPIPAPQFLPAAKKTEVIKPPQAEKVLAVKSIETVKPLEEKKAPKKNAKTGWFPWAKKEDAKTAKAEKPTKDKKVENPPKERAAPGKKVEPLGPPVAKKVESEKPAPAKKSAAKEKAVVKAAAPAGQGAGTDRKKTPVINKWFGMETGVSGVTIQRPEIPQIVAGKIPDDNIFSLQDCINIAIKNNIPLQVSQKSVKLAQMRVMEARRNMLPSATIAFEPYTGKVGARNYIGRKQYIEGKQPIFHGGELYFTLKQAETNLEITRNESEKIKNELTFQVKKAYYTLAKAEDNLLMQTELSGEIERIFQMVNDQYDAKVASKLELLNVSSQSSQIKYQFASADGDVAVAELILKQAMNIDPEITVKIRSNLEFNRIKVRYEEALRAALTNRPEIRINLLMVEYYAYGKRINGAKTMPKIDLMGSWGMARENYTPLDNAWGKTDAPGAPVFNTNAEQKLEEQWYAGVKTSIPMWGSTAEYSFTKEQWTPVISAFQGTEATTNSYKLKLFDNLAMYSDVQLSEIDYDRARQELNKIRQDITLEVKEQCFSYEKALIQLDTASNKVRYQESDFEVAKAKRELDEMSDSGVVESMIKLSQEKFGYVQALADCHTSVANINKAIGVEDYFKDE